jgi:hypothetical protein
MALTLNQEATAEEVEFITAEGVAQFDADFEEEFGDFGDFSDESGRIVAGSDGSGGCSYSNDCTC